MPPDPPVAAGGVPWRRDDGVLRLALVHRPRYDDWTFPKGKLKDGEHPLLAATREVAEETGLTVVVGRRLPRTSYLSADGPKSVDYWCMQGSGEFRTNDETDGMEWLTPEETLDRLTYDDDRALVADLLSAPVQPIRFLLVRHARAGDSEQWTGPDLLRPLDEAGVLEAAALAAILPVFGPMVVRSADPLRCRQTVQPLADRLGVAVGSGSEFSEDTYFGARQVAQASANEILGSEPVTVVCSQGGVIPDLLEWLFSANPPTTGVSPRRVDSQPPARKGSLWAMSADRGRVVSADYYADFQP